MTALVLIDTCAWVDFLRSRVGSLGDRVEQALADDCARLCSVTVAELLQGVRGNKERQQLVRLLDHVPCLPVIEDDWRAAGLGLQALRVKGLNVPLTDALIAAVARRHQLPVLTVDEHFNSLSVALA